MTLSNNNRDDSCDKLMKSKVKNLFCENSEKRQLTITQALAKEVTSIYEKGIGANDANDKDYNPVDDLISFGNEETNSSHEFKKFSAKRKMRKRQKD